MPFHTSRLPNGIPHAPKNISQSRSIIPPLADHNSCFAKGLPARPAPAPSENNIWHRSNMPLFYSLPIRPLTEEPARRQQRLLCIVCDNIVPARNNTAAWPPEPSLL